MATQPLEEHEDDAETPEIEGEPEEVGEIEGAEGAETPADPEGEPQSDEYVLEIEGEQQEEQETAPIRQLRKRVRELERENSQYRQQSAPKRTEVGPKPTFEGCEFDEDKFATALDAWHDRKRAADREEADASKAQEAQAAEWAKVQQAYVEKKAKLPMPDYQAAEDEVVATLPTMLQGLILKYTDDPAKVTYVLGKHPQRLAALAAEADPIRALIAVRDIEKGIKMARRKAPPPEERLTGGVPAAAGSIEKQRDKLLAEAQRTGNMDKYRAFNKANPRK